MAVTPTPSNGCVGTDANGNVLTQLKCVKAYSEGLPSFECIGWRLFYVNCPKVNVQCNPFSSAYVAASVVCNQKLF